MTTPVRTWTMRALLSASLGAGAMPAFAAVGESGCAPSGDSSVASIADPVGEALSLRAGLARLPEGVWNGRGEEPAPSYFTDLRKGSDLWKHLVGRPELAASARSRSRVMLSLRSMRITSNETFDVTVEIYAGYRDRRNRTVTVRDVPLALATSQLKREEGTGRKAIFPLPLGIYTQEGSAVAYPTVTARDPEALAEMADFLGVPMETTAWNPSSPLYDAIGTHKLVAIDLHDVDVSVYGEVKVRYTPTYADYDMDDVHDDGLVFRMLHVDAPYPQATDAYLPYLPTRGERSFAGDPRRPKVFDPVVAAVNAVLGPNAPQ